MADCESSPVAENKDLSEPLLVTENVSCNLTIPTEDPRMDFGWSRSSLRNLFSILFVVLFSFFWLAKINGYFDFTGRYNIKCLRASRYSHGALFMLDDELKTSWSNKEAPHDNDYLIINFRFPQIINRVEIVSSSSPKLKLMSWDSDSCKSKNIKYHCQHDKGNNIYVYILEENDAIQNIRIEIDDKGTQVSWTVEELRFDIIKSKN